ncbi:MAG: DUF2974 domain-containing protein [Bacilli bacterium]|nr:DUF2974 domain-containing protein [Bacilli bacterium]
MNIFDYLNYYGKYTFDDKPFNEIDNAIFSELAYVDFNGIVSNDNKHKIRLKDAAKAYLDFKGNIITNDIITVKESLKLLIAAKDTDRFKDILLYNYKNNITDKCQFSCLTFEINKRLVYVSFEGTDKVISGWIENAKMSYEYPVLAHSYAINYLNKYFKHTYKRIIVGGHSKGGNLALVSALGCKKSIYKRIINIYSNDGQGLRKEETNLKRYNDLLKKYIHIVPYNSIVGMLLYHDMYYLSVDSDKKPGVSHLITNWKIDYDHFKTREISKFSKVIDEGVNTWIDKYDNDSKREFVNSLGQVLKKNGVITLIDFISNKRLILDVLKSVKDVDPLVKNMTLDLIKIIGKLNITN